MKVRNYISANFIIVTLYTLMGLDSQNIGYFISDAFDFHIINIPHKDIQVNSVCIHNIEDIPIYTNKIIFFSFHN